MLCISSHLSIFDVREVLLWSDVWGLSSPPSPCDYEECAPGNYKPPALEFPLHSQLSADFVDYLIVEGCGGFRRRPFSQHQQNPQPPSFREHPDHNGLCSPGEHWYHNVSFQITCYLINMSKPQLEN